MRISLRLACLLLGAGASHLAIAATAPSTTVKLGNETLSVTLDPTFPRTITYQAGPHTLDGQSTAVREVELNGQAADCQIRFRQTTASTGEYRLTFDAAKIALTLRVAVGKDVVTWTLDDVVESGGTRIRTLALPRNAALTISTARPTAALATVFATHVHDQYVASFREVIAPLAQLKPVADTGNYLFLSDGKLAAGIASDQFEDVKRSAYQISESNGVKTCHAQCPLWQVRSFDDERPARRSVMVFITPDCNGDGQATWQDAAMVYRRQMPMPYGHEWVKSTVGENIAMNFASGAQQPFLKILDELKKCALATDFLGQQVTIKGFSAEGHDSANTDYAGHVNQRAGGLRDFNFLLEHAADATARVGIHINASEVYPEAHRYDPAILQRQPNGQPKPGWVWLDHAHMIDKVKDTRGGQLFAALDALKRESPKLGYIYLDTYWENAWPAAQIAGKFASLKLPFGTEGSTALDPWCTWAHWRTVNSQIMRFIWYSQRDIFANDPILRGGRSDDDTFMGWQNRHAFKNFINGTFSRHLPAKYLAHFDLLRWIPGQEAEFSDGVKVVKSGDSVTVTQHGRTVMTWNGGGTGSRLFVPWDPRQATKIYAWDEVGGRQTWELPPSWPRHGEVWLYPLDGHGRGTPQQLTITEGKITLEAAKNTPYVIYPKKAPSQKPMDFGAGSGLASPGFDAPTLDDWHPQPPAAARIMSDANGNDFLQLSGPDPASVSQDLKDLKPGQTYAACVWVQIKGRRPARLEVTCGGRSTVAQIDRTTIVHRAPNDPRNGSNYQRLQLLFDVPAGSTRAQLRLAVEPDPSGDVVEFDDVRIAATRRSPEASQHFFWEDFEQVPMGGYGPFAQCPGERTHLSEVNPPHTSDTLRGRFSLKSRDSGRIGRTLPSTLHFKPLTRYRLRALTLGAGHLTAITRGQTVLNLKFPNTGHAAAIDGTFATHADSDSYLELFRDPGADAIVIDDLAIDELGPAPAPVRKIYLDGLPGRAILLEESFARPLTNDWTLITSKQPGTSVRAGDGGLNITAAAHVSALAERPLPNGTTAVECRLRIDGDQGQTWGPGMALRWPNGQQLRVNVRVPDGKIQVESTAAGKITGGSWAPTDSVALRVRLDDDQWIVESRTDDQAWATLATFPKTALPDHPQRLRLGKMHAFETDDHSEAGDEGSCAFERLRVYGQSS